MKMNSKINNMVNVLIISGQGINCEQEMFWSYKLLDVKNLAVSIVHINSILDDPNIIHKYDLINFPGGFSFGDNLTSGKVLANFIKHKRSSSRIGAPSMLEEMKIFIQNGGYILGVCNGFQMLVKLGLLPNINLQFEMEVTLKENSTANFENRWCRFAVNTQNKSPFFRGIDFIELPIRCGEGRLLIRDGEIYDAIISKNLHLLQYVDDKNQLTNEPHLNPCGSDLYLAAISDISGQVVGMMPHPEAYLNIYNHPNWPTIMSDRRCEQNGEDLPVNGSQIFKNIINHILKIKS
ncbi:MAG: phosphoribosylformylglycinamidine synthase subunit PurQ [Oligoflexia bacterium]|nr:phosphoribosylformylglycinamidine synthase subunit PurQ [Oligoflexia bacterium]